MDSHKKRLPQLAELELEAEEEFRSLVRAHLESKCQSVAEQQGCISPLKRSETGSLPVDDAEADDKRRQD